MCDHTDYFGTIMPRIVAFVTGICDYEELFELKDANKAAVALATVLKKLPGAKVYEAYDCNFTDFQMKYKAFLGEIKSGDIVIFFFKGHGCQWKKKPLLVAQATDEETRMELEIEAESIGDRAINVHTLQKELRTKGTALNVILLDCCGEFEYGRATRGYEIIRPEDKEVFHIDTDEKTIIGFSCSPGDEAYKGKGPKGESGFGTHHCKFVS